MTTEQKVFQGAQKLHKFLITLLEACHYTPKKKKKIKTFSKLQCFFILFVCNTI